MSLIPNGVVRHTLWRLSGGSTCIFQLPLSDDEIASAHKMRMVLELCRRGRVGAHASLTFCRGAHKVFSIPMVSGCALYFRCLLLAPALFARCLEFIMSSRPRSYYRCLLELADLQPIVDIPQDRLSQLSAAFFLGLLRGQIPDFDAAERRAILGEAGVLGVLDDGQAAAQGEILPALEPPRAEDIVGVGAGGADIFDEFAGLPPVRLHRALHTLSCQRPTQGLHPMPQ